MLDSQLETIVDGKQYKVRLRRKRIDLLHPTKKSMHPRQIKPTYEFSSAMI